MTLEEKAKEYAHNNYEILIDTDDAFVTSEAYLEQGYLAGAKELEKENAELKEKIKGLENILKKQLHCNGCVHSDSPCMPSDYKKDENDLCDNYESVFDKLQELEKELAEYKKKDKRLKCKQKYFVTSQTVDNGLVYKSVVCNTVYDCELCDKYRE